MSSARPVASGLLLCDSSGRVVFSEGDGREPVFAELMRDEAWLADARSRRMLPLETGHGRFVALLVPTVTANLLVLHRETSDVVLDFVTSVDFAYDILRQVLSDPFDALTVVDDKARVAFISPVHESFFGLKRGEAIGRPVRSVIENTRLPEVVRTGKSEVGVIQRMRGRDRVVTRRAIERDGKVVGAMGRVMFGSPKHVEALSQRIKALEGEVAFYRREAEVMRREAYDIGDIVGSSPAIAKLRSDIGKIAGLDLPVLVLGESGVGKELVAHAIHKSSPRRAAPMIAVNAAAMPASLIESELFGYEAGSFTGADRKGRKGKIEAAAGGTLFLDEIGDMPLEVQAKLLRVLEDNIVQRIGGDTPRKINFRLICATNHSLGDLVARGKFRLDLFFRINTITLDVPSLNRRPEDIPALISHFVDAFVARHRRQRPKISPEVYPYLQTQDWPGNIRQLRHAVERALALNETGSIGVADFANDPLMLPTAANRVEPSDDEAPVAAVTSRVKDAVARTRDDLIREAMKRHGGNKLRVARELGISRSFLYKRLEALGE